VPGEAGGRARHRGALRVGTRQATAVAVERIVRDVDALAAARREPGVARHDADVARTDLGHRAVAVVAALEARLARATHLADVRAHGVIARRAARLALVRGAAHAVGAVGVRATDAALRAAVVGRRGVADAAAADAARADLAVEPADPAVRRIGLDRR